MEKYYGQYPKDVGIIAIDIYFPRTAVSQKSLEKFDQVPEGKYTIGLGQEIMSFVGDREDINSMCLTVTNNLLDKYKIDPRQIGRLEVGTETLFDKSKSTKTILMELFKNSGNNDIEGVDTKNACYGGTNALFNSLNWIESSAWDGRLALVVAGDIAVYAKGPARPTGGAGAVAMLIGPNAALVFDRGVRTSYMSNTYDFYKPDPSVEFPVVDGKLSNKCYLEALDNCYMQFAKKWANFNSGKLFNLNCTDFVCFHSPYNKLVQKSYSRMLYTDALNNPSDREFIDVQNLLKVDRNLSYFNRQIETEFMKKSAGGYKSKVSDSTFLPRKLGNLYTASLYSSLISLIVMQGDNLLGKRVLLFSYGSGLTASLFSLQVKRSVLPIVKSLNIKATLESRTLVDPATYNTKMDLRKERYSQLKFIPTDSLDTMFDGTWYLSELDEKQRRHYLRLVSSKL